MQQSPLSDAYLSLTTDLVPGHFWFFRENRGIHITHTGLLPVRGSEFIHNGLKSFLGVLSIWRNMSVYGLDDLPGYKKSHHPPNAFQHFYNPVLS